MNTNQTLTSKSRLWRFRKSGLVAVLLLFSGMVLLWQGNNSDSNSDESLFHPVELGAFIFKVVEPGEVESSSNVDVICEVKSRNSSGTVILEIVPEGMDKDDFLCKLDDSELQNQLLKSR